MITCNPLFPDVSNLNLYGDVPSIIQSGRAHTIPPPGTPQQVYAHFGNGLFFFFLIKANKHRNNLGFKMAPTGVHPICIKTFTPGVNIV